MEKTGSPSTSVTTGCKPTLVCHAGPALENLVAILGWVGRCSGDSEAFCIENHLNFLLLHHRSPLSGQHTLDSSKFAGFSCLGDGNCCDSQWADSRPHYSCPGIVAEIILARAVASRRYLNNGACTMWTKITVVGLLVIDAVVVHIRRSASSTSITRWAHFYHGPKALRREVACA